MSGFWRVIKTVLAVAACGLTCVCAAAEEPAALDATDAGRMEKTMEFRLLEFVRHNYPERVNGALRSLQSQEGALRRSMLSSIQLMQEYARGPVTLEGDWQEVRDRRRFVLVGVMRGLQDYPRAVVRSVLYPGRFRPFTVVYVDRDGDGWVDEQSDRLTRSDRILRWFRERFPRGA